jgi:hypothetical protein
MSFHRVVAVMVACGVLQAGCAGSTIHESPVPTSPPSVQATALGCSAEMTRDENGCVFTWGTELKAEEYGDAPAFFDGRTRVACGNVDTVCGFRVTCKCTKGAAPP